MNKTDTNALRFKEAESNPLVVIDLNTLRTIIGETFKDSWESFGHPSALKSKSSDTRNNEELLNTEEAMKLLKVSKVTIHNWKKKGIIKSHKIGRKLFFKKHEILESIKRQKYSTNSSLQSL